MFLTTEQKARLIGDSPSLLKRRLIQARAMLTTEYRRRFLSVNYDFCNRRLLSDDGKIALQWLIREFPDQPVSYDNQQTATGTVVVLSTRNEVVPGWTTEEILAREG